MLKPKQVKCLQLMVKGTMKDSDIAKEINITPKTICEWKKQTEFQEEYNRMMRGQLQFAAPRAFRKQLSLLNSKNDMVAHLAAKDILDRSGFIPVERIEQSVDMDLNISVDYGNE